MQELKELDSLLKKDSPTLYEEGFDKEFFKNETELYILAAARGNKKLQEVVGGHYGVYGGYGRMYQTARIYPLQQFYKKAGYDGILFNDREIVAFDSNQIKHIDNKGSYTDTKGNITKTKPNNKEAKHTYFNENSPNIMYANPKHLGSGLISGSVSGIETDENGNIVGFNPAKFAAGFLGGVAGSKAVAKGLEWRANKVAKSYPNIAKDNPALMSEIAKRDLQTYAVTNTHNALTRFLNNNKLLDVNPQLFAGKKALVNEAYAPHKARLEKAKELESSGADEIEIWEKTGWYKDKDKKWKFEISQSGGEFDWDLLKSIRYDYSRDNNYMKLKEVLQDRELFQAYPELQDLKIQADPLGEDILGEYKKDKKKISLELDTLKSPQEAKSTLYHEIQHAIQDIEGFAYGEKQWENSIWDFNKYRNRHGEVEARNVQNRMQQVSGYETKKPPKEQIQKSIDTIDKNIQKAEQKIQEIKNGIGKYKGVSQKDKERSIKTNLEFIDSALRGRERAIKLRDNYTQTPHPYKTMDTPLKDTIAESTMQGEALSKEPTNKVENMLESSNKILGETMTLKDRLLIDNNLNIVI
mgnify:FL=1